MNNSRNAQPRFDPAAAVEAAKKAALTEVRDKFQSPEELARLDEIRAAYAKTKETVDAQLSSALSAHISDMLDGRELLESSQRRLKHLRQSIGEIDRLCGETGFLIERYDLISSLSTVRMNLEFVVSKATTILDLPKEAQDTLDALQKDGDEAELYRVHEQLCALEAKCAEAKRVQKIDDSLPMSQQGEREKLVLKYLEKARESDPRVNVSMGKFEDKIWQLLREAVLDADLGAPTLIRVLRVVEQQEALEAVMKQRREEAENVMLEDLRRDRAEKEAAAKIAAGTHVRKKRGGAGHIRAATVAVGGGIKRTAGAVAGVAAGAVGAIANALPLPGVGRLIGPDLSDPNISPAEMAAAQAATQEAFDLAAVAQAMKHRVAKSKGYRAKAVAAVEKSIDDLIHRTVSQKGLEFKDVLVGLEDIPVKHMLDMHTYTVPCFPESYNIWEVIVRRFVARLALFYDGVAADVLSNDPNGRGYSQGQLLDLIRAHIFFTDNIRQLEDIDEEWLEFGVDDTVIGTGDFTFEIYDPEAEARAALRPPAAVKPPKKARGGATDRNGKAVKVPSEDLAKGERCGKGVDTIMDKFVERAMAKIVEWMENLVKADLDVEPKEDADGHLITDTGVEFMRLLNQQIDMVAQVTQGELLARLVESFAKLFADFQRIQDDLVGKSVEGLGDDALEKRFMQLCAYVNSNSRLYDDAEQMRSDFAPEDPIASISDDEDEGSRRGAGGGRSKARKVTLDADVAYRGDSLSGAYAGFLRTAKKAVIKVVEVIFAGKGFKDAFDKLFCHPDWFVGTPTEAIIAGLASYIEDVQVYIMPDWFPRAIEALAEGTAGSYFGIFAMKCTEVDPKTHARMAKDLHMLRDLFEETLGADPKRTDAKARVDRIFRQLTDIHDLAGAKDEQEFIECWNDVLTNDPSKGIGIVSRVLDFRRDLNDKTKAAILKRCTELWEHRRGAKGGNLLLKGIQSGVDVLGEISATTQQMLGVMHGVAMQGGKKMRGILEKTLEGWTT